MKGDRIEVLVDVGDGVRSFDVVARKAGRRVEASVVRGQVEVAEVTRSGRPVRSARFMASRVVAIVEHPAGDPIGDEEGGEQKRPEVPQGSLFDSERR